MKVYANSRMSLRSLRAVLVAGIAIVSTCFVGCGHRNDGPKTYVSTGVVLFEGEPVESGRVLFRSLEGDGRGFSAPISNGKFRIETYAGKMRVEVRASRDVPGQFDYSNGEPAAVGEMYIPQKYNSQSELVTNIPADDAIQLELQG